MDGKHTPGNWMAASRPSSVVGWPIVASPSGRVIANLAWMPGLTPELEAEIAANARLIAVAPDMLAILKDSVEILDVLIEDREGAIGEECEVSRDLRDRIRAAIAKTSLTPPAPHSDEAGS